MPESKSTPSEIANHKKFIAWSLAVALVYVIGYGVCRSQGELVHRKTWNSGWNRHWIEPGYTEPQPLTFAPLHVPGDDEYNAAMDQFHKEFEAIETRRRMLGILFLPLRCMESATWWLVDARQ